LKGEQLLVDESADLGIQVEEAESPVGVSGFEGDNIIALLQTSSAPRLGLGRERPMWVSERPSRRRGGGWLSCGFHDDDFDAAVGGELCELSSAALGVFHLGPADGELADDCVVDVG
jgi:hypothetical protein